jgi:hypothetical protein
VDQLDVDAAKRLGVHVRVLSGAGLADVAPGAKMKLRPMFLPTFAPSIPSEGQK